MSDLINREDTKRAICVACLGGEPSTLYDLIKGCKHHFDCPYLTAVGKMQSADVVEVPDKSMIPIVKDFIKDLEKFGSRATCADIIKRTME